MARSQDTVTSQSLYRPPGVPGLYPASPGFKPAGDQEAELVNSSIGISGSVETLVGASTQSFYKVVSKSSLPRELFVRRVAKKRLESFRYTTSLNCWLADRGVITNTVISEHVCLDGSGDVFAVSPYIDWRPARPDRADAGLLGKSLACLHEALSVHPDRGRWEKATRTRLNHLNEIRQELASGNLASPVEQKVVRALCKRSEVDFDNYALPHVPLHGDPHSFNLLVHQDNSEVTVVDFEDVFHSVFPVVFDLAVVIQRVFLMQERDDEALTRLVNHFIASYGIKDEMELSQMKQLIPDVLRGLALRAFCVSADCVRLGIEVPDQEWEKFLFLFRQIERRQHVFL